MQKESKDGSKRKGQMMEVVGMDLGNLGRASLSLNGNVTITGNMIFQDQELVRSSLSQTQNTHLEFDQKQHLNIQGKIGDRITVNMDQDSERQFDWENNIRIAYDGLEDDIVQKVEAGNISLSLPSTKYVTFSGKNQGLFGVKSVSKLGPVDVTAIASIELTIKEQSEWEGGGLSNIQQIRYFKIDKKLSLGAKRNYMHSKVNGDFVVYMDDDDYYPPERVRDAVIKLNGNKQALAAGSSEIYIYFKFTQGFNIIH